MKQVVTLIYCDYRDGNGYQCRARTHSRISLQFRRKSGWAEIQGDKDDVLDYCPEHSAGARNTHR